MSKITFRADDDLVERIEAHDASKSEVMREALRAYLDAPQAPSGSPQPSGRSPDGAPRRPVERRNTHGGRHPSDRLTALSARVDRLAARLDQLATTQSNPGVTLAVEGDGLRVGQPSGSRRVTDEQPADTERSSDTTPDRDTRASDTHDDRSCAQCGTTMEADHVFCPNCGEKTANRLFCDCGDEVRSDWSFCPGCGRRTPAADVLSASDSPDR